MQKVTVTVEQTLDEETILSTASHESEDMDMVIWRYAIAGAALSAGFSIHALNEMILQWADEISPNDSEELINIPAEYL